jgi:uncharacterized RDD family membrane protein YckC
VAARLLDAIILGIVFGGIFSAIVLSGDDDGGFAGFNNDASFGKIYLLGLLGAVVGFFWDAVMTKQYGGTPMKLAFGMRVVRADNGADVEWSHAITRWSIPGAFALIPIPFLPDLARFVIVIVSLVFIFSKPLRQAVWDQVAKTIVVTTR